eukprot:4702445-Prorocentrum_lima.AAC.1
MGVLVAEFRGMRRPCEPAREEATPAEDASAAVKEPAAALAMYASVKIRGLSARADLNGKLGVVSGQWSDCLLYTSPSPRDSTSS